MFMRCHGGAVGHKTTREETKSLLEDRDKLDKVPFKLESEHDWEHGSDMEMGNGSGSGDNDEMQEDASTNEDIGSEVEDGDHTIDENKSDSDASDMAFPETESTSLVDEELLDKMDEFDYSGLDRVEDGGEEQNDDRLQEDAFGAEDVENLEGEWGMAFCSDLSVTCITLEDLTRIQLVGNPESPCKTLHGDGCTVTMFGLVSLCLFLLISRVSVLNLQFSVTTPRILVFPDSHGSNDRILDRSNTIWQ